jgi:hypothetical protein
VGKYGRARRAVDEMWRTRIACWIHNVTNTHLEYVILIAFPLQQWLQKHTSMSRYKYTACLFIYMVHEKPVLIFNSRIILF